MHAPAFLARNMQNSAFAGADCDLLSQSGLDIVTLRECFIGGSSLNDHFEVMGAGGEGGEGGAQTPPLPPSQPP